MGMNMDIVNDKVSVYQNSKISNRTVNDNQNRTEVKRNFSSYIGTNASQNTKVVINAEIMMQRYEKELADKNTNEVHEIEQKINDIFNKMTASDIEDLTKQGFDFKNVNVKELSEIVKSMKEQLGYGDSENTSKYDSICADEETLKQIMQELKAAGITVDAGSISSVLAALNSANLPESTDNVADVVKNMNTANSIPKLSDKAVKYMIKHDLDATIYNLYKAEHSVPDNSKVRPITNQQFEELKPQIESIIKQAGFEVNKENMNTARWILDNDLPLTASTLVKNDLLKVIGEPIDQKMLLTDIVNTMVEGDKAENTLLAISMPLQEAQEIVEEVNKIKDIDIQKVVIDNRKITINEFIFSRRLREQGNNQSDNQNIRLFMDHAQQKTFMSAKRQIEEIRLKMTVEIGYTMIQKGINIKTDNLERVVEQLKIEERDQYKTLLSRNNLMPTDENASLIMDTMDKTAEMKVMASFTLASIRSVNTINEIHETGNLVTEKIKMAMQSYETLKTTIRVDMGDTIEKAFQSIDSILANEGIEVTEQNIRAAKILGYNRLEITPHSIDEINLLDKKVNYMLDSFNPGVIVHMMKKGINPLNTPLDQLNEELKKINKEQKFSPDEKYSEFLWKEENRKKITETERSSFIGLYRLLSNIEKSEGRAVGYLVDTSQEITLKNLLTAIKTIEKKGIDETVDERFGELLEDINYATRNLTEQLGKVFGELSEGDNTTNGTNNANKVEYNAYIVDEIMSQITPSKLHNISKKHNISELSLDKLNELLKENVQEDGALDREYAKQQLEEIKQVTIKSESAIKFLLENRQDATLNNIMAAKMMIDNKNSIFDKWKKRLEQEQNKEDIKSFMEEIDTVIDSVSDEQALQEKCNNVSDHANEIIDKNLKNNSITSKDIIELKAFGHGFRLMQDMAQEENYQVPLIIGGNITNINLKFIHKSDNETTQIKIKFQTEYLGNVEAELSLQEEEMKAYIQVDKKDSVKIIENSKKQLMGQMETLGYSLKDVHICYENGGNSNG